MAIDAMIALPNASENVLADSPANRAFFRQAWAGALPAMRSSRRAKSAFPSALTESAAREGAGAAAGVGAAGRWGEGAPLPAAFASPCGAGRAASASVSAASFASSAARRALSSPAR